MAPKRKALLWLAIWIAAALLAYVVWWWPGGTSLSAIPADKRLFVLKLPADGPLTGLIDRDAVLTLAVAAPPNAPQPVKPAAPKALPVAGPAAPLPADIVRVDHVYVYRKKCGLEVQASHRVAACYAIVAVPQDSIEAFMRAPDKVWAWLEQPPGAKR
jgi:hypothetical protein